MDIRYSKQSDLPVIMSIIADAQHFLAAQNIDQWQDGYPDEARILKDIQENESFVISDEHQIIGTSVFSLKGDSNYDHIEGEWLTPKNAEFGVIHRIAVRNTFRKKGFANFVFDHFENELQQKGITSMRIDTHEQNLTMQNILQKRNYVYCGVIYLESGAKRLAYEKII